MDDFNEKCKKYYKSKAEYYEELEKHKKDIINSGLSKKEKREKVKSMDPINCVNCHRKVGTIFENILEDSNRIITAKCGSITDPCSLDWKLYLGDSVYFLEDIAKEENEINYLKKEIIILKNNLLFHYGNDVEIMKNFNKLTKLLSDKIDSYEYSLSKYNEKLNKKEKEQKYVEIVNELTQVIELFKAKCKEYEINPNILLLQEITDIYVSQILPLIQEKKENNYHLIKLQYDVFYLEQIIDEPKVIKWVEGYNTQAQPKVKKGKKKENPEEKPKFKKISLKEKDKDEKEKKTKKVGKVKLVQAKGEGEEGESEGEESDINEDYVEDEIVEDIEEMEFKPKFNVSIEEDNNSEYEYEGGYPEDFFFEEEEQEDEGPQEKLNIGGVISLNDVEEIK